jgi:hypothetical protein
LIHSVFTSLLESIFDSFDFLRPSDRIVDRTALSTVNVEKPLTMALTSIADLSDGQKEELVASLSCLVIGNGEVSAEKLSAIASAAGCSVSDPMAALFASVVASAPKGMDSFAPPPGGGGGGGG